MSYSGLDARSTIALVTDPAQHTYLRGSADGYPQTRSGITFGWVSSSGFFDDLSASNDPRIAGFINMNTYFCVLRADTTPGQYTFAMAMNTASTGASYKQSLAIFDGDVNDPITPATQATVLTGLVDWSATTAFTVGKYLIVNGKLYRCTTAGTSGSTAPSHSSGAAADGSAQWTYIRSALHVAQNLNPTSNFVDAAGVARTTAAWPGSNTASGAVTITSDHFSVIKTSEGGNSTRLSYVGWQPVAMPLGDVTLRDMDDLTLGSSPLICARQPAGKLLARIAFTVGQSATSTFAITGAWAPYVTVVQRGTAFWLAATNLRIPDNFSGTLTIRQTEANSELFTGSPRDTSFTPTVVSSGGRPTDTSVLGLISSECWLLYSAIKTIVDAEWQGFPNDLSGVTFYADVAVSNFAALVSQFNTFAGQTANGRKFRIRLQTGDYSGSVTSTSEADFLRDGTGGLVIMPAAGHDPAFEGSIYFTGMHRGVEVRDLLCTGSGSSSYHESFRSVPTTADAQGSSIIFRNNRFLGKNWTQDGFSPRWFPIRCFGTRVARVLGNIFRGVANAIDLYDTYAGQVAYNDFQQNTDDLIGTGASGKWRLFHPLKDIHYLIHDNVVRNAFDYYPPDSTPSSVPHADFNQERRMTAYPGLTFTSTAATSVALGSYVCNAGNFYECTSAGTTAANSGGPVHTSGAAMDGTVQWTWRSTINNAPTSRKVIYNNVLNVGGVAYDDDTVSPGGPYRFHVTMQFHIHSNDAMPIDAAVFNNVHASSIKRGWCNEQSQYATSHYQYLEYNTFVGSSELPPGTNAFTGFTQVASIVPGSADPCGPRIRALRNLVGTIDTDRAAFDEGNIIIDYHPGTATGVRYEDLLRGLTTGFTTTTNGYRTFSGLDDSGTNGMAAFRSDMSKQLHLLTGRAGALSTENYAWTQRFTDAIGATLDVPMAISVTP